MRGVWRGRRATRLGGRRGRRSARRGGERGFGIRFGFRGSIWMKRRGCITTGIGTLIHKAAATSAMTPSVWLVGSISKSMHLIRWNGSTHWVWQKPERLGVITDQSLHIRIRDTMTRRRQIFVEAEKHPDFLATMKLWRPVLCPMLRDGTGTQSITKESSIDLAMATMEPCIGMVTRLKMAVFLFLLA